MKLVLHLRQYAVLVVLIHSWRFVSFAEEKRRSGEGFRGDPGSHEL